MYYENTKITASYHPRTEAERRMMDATALGVVAAYGGKNLGAYDTLGNDTRTHQFEMSYNRAERAIQDLADLGFLAEMRLA